MTDKPEATSSRTILWVASIATLIWFAGGGAFLFFSKTCDVSGVGFLATHLNCLLPNELGDLLAGFFAPVAFFWVVAAVLLQKGELQAQREELGSRLITSS